MLPNEKLLGFFVKAGAWTRLRSSVLHSLQVYTYFAVPACWLSAAFLFQDNPGFAGVLFWVGLVLLVFPVIAHTIWSFVNPERLLSEKYQLQHQLLMLQGRSPLPEEVNSFMLEAVTNPELEELPVKAEGKG